MAVVGTTAHGLGLGRCGIVAAGREHDDLLHQPGAGAAAGTGLGALAHLFQREQALVLDGLADGSLGHAVAAAHLVAIGHGRGLVLALVAGISQIGFAKHQLVADIGHAAAFAQQLEVPAAIHRIAIQAGADQLVILDDQLFVDSRIGVAHQNLFGIAAALEVAGREQVDARDLELGRGQRPQIAADAKFGQMVGQHLALFKKRCHQPIGSPPVRSAFTHCVDARVGHGLQRVADHDAPIHMQMHGFSQPRVGAYADGHNDQISPNLAAILEAHRAHAAAGVTQQFLRLCMHAELHASLGKRLLQHLAGPIVKLALHQPVPHMHNRNLHAAFHQTVRGLQSQQATTDHHRMPECLCRLDHGLGVGNVPVGQHTLQVLAGNGQNKRVGARCHDQAVVASGGFLTLGIDRMHRTTGTVHGCHGIASVQQDVIILVPGPVVEHDIAERLLPGQHRRQQDTVVVGMRLGAKHRDVVQIGSNGQQLLQRAYTRHSVANHDQFGFFHLSPRGLGKKKTSARCMTCMNA
ncbi:hypothetical protein D3C72_981510 [compost metagenome]